MEYNEEFINKMIQVGTFGYPLSKIINVLEIADISEFTEDFDDPESLVYKAYKKGKDKADFIMDTRLFQKAKTGDLQAMELYSYRKGMQSAIAESETFDRQNPQIEE